MVRVLMIIVVILISNVANAKNLGTRGQTYAVREQDFRTFIAQRLAFMQRHGQIKAYADAAKKRVTQHVYHPTALSLGTRTDTKRYFVDPSVRLNRPIVDNIGRVLVPAGTVINPFKTVHLNSVMIFFNGDSPSQVKWVEQHYKQYRIVKFVLTGGKLQAMAKRFGRIYFDQRGFITQKLHITSVPAVAQQAGLKWKITLIGTKAF